MKWNLAAALLPALLLVSCSDQAVPVDAPDFGSDASRGREKIAYYGCGSCHTIPE
jgi:hypothetical protein